VYVGQAKVSALKAKSELRMVEAQEMQDRCVEIADVDGILGNIKAQFIGLAVGDSRFEAPTSDPHRERIRVMIPAVCPSL
jgi:hypothetical protein